MSLSSIVNVQITRLTQSVSQAGFGTLMILGTSKRYNDRIRYFSNMSEVAESFRSYDREYIAAQDVFAQSPAPARLAIGRRTCNSATIRVITAMNAQTYNVKINGVDNQISSVPTAQYSVITFSGNFSAGNTIDLQVNASAITQVVASASTPNTMDAIAAQILLKPNIASAEVDGLTITVMGEPNIDAIVSSLVVAIGSGSAPPTGAVALFDQPVSNINIADALATEINGSALGVTADSSANDGTLTITADIAGVPYTLDVSTSIINPNQALVTVTQVEPNQTYTVTINKRKFEYTAPNDVTSAEEIAGALIDLINFDPAFPVGADFDTDAQETTITLNNDILTGQAVAITLNGAPLTSIPFNQTHVQTMKDICTALQSQPGIESAQLFGPTSRGIQLFGQPDQNAIVSVFTVTGPGTIPVATLVDNDQATGTIILTSNDATKTFTITVTAEILSLQKGLQIEDLVASDPVQDDLDAVSNSNNDWYGVALTSRAVQDILATADWVEARPKLFGTCSSQEAIINESANDDQSSLAYQLFSAGYTRTFLLYHQDADDDYPECAWMGRCLPLEPGSETWKFKSLNTIPYSNLNTTQAINAQTKSCNTYQFVGGRNITAEGVVSSGEFIDIIRGVDWLTARIQEFVFFVLVNNNKVPYTDTGIAMIEAEVRRALELGVTNNFLAADPQYTIEVPRAAAVPANDKANRILRNVSFQATLAGAIHFVEIRGVVSV